MENNALENSPQFSEVLAGTMKWGHWGANLGTIEMAKLIEQCIEIGVSSFDHADIYGGYTTEAAFGKAFKQTGVERNKIQIITKCGICIPSSERPQFKLKYYNTCREYIIACAEQSLRNLQTDYLDLLLIHRPSPLMNFEEMAEAFTFLKESGLIFQAGVSNFTAMQFENFMHFFPLSTNQIEASILHLDPFKNGTLDMCQKHKTKPMAWSPLGGGRLFKAFSDPIEISRQNRIRQLADQWGLSIEELSYAFLFKHPSGIMPVTGTSKIERIKKAVYSLRVELSEEQWFEVWTASKGENVP